MDLSSIPIARSINPDGPVDLTRLSCLNSPENNQVLDGGWTVNNPIGRSLGIVYDLPISAVAVSVAAELSAIYCGVAAHGPLWSIRILSGRGIPSALVASGCLPGSGL
jgi:hypothetical protein